MQISEHLPKIISKIEQNVVTSVIAGTGSGKSIGIPSGFLAKHPGVRFFIVVPTRTAARGLAEYQKLIQERLKQGGHKSCTVGYAAEGDIRYSENTEIVYVTGGHARLKMLSYFDKGLPKKSGIDFCEVLMIDEIHLGSIDNTLLIGLWDYAAQNRVKVPYLVLASATPSHIDTLKNYKIEEITVEVMSYPVSISYNEKDYKLSNNKQYDSLHTDTARLAIKLHQSNSVETGHMLIFAAGSSEIDMINSTIRNLLGEKGDPTMQIIPIISTMSAEDIKKIYSEVKGQRKIIISTNMTETSITIENLGYVIDTLVEKRAETSLTGGLRLVTHMISKASANQRKGRTGRTREGQCYRMCTKATFDKLEDHRPPEIERVPIDNVVIQLINSGLPVNKILTSVKNKKLDISINTLRELKMIDVLDKSMQVTNIGIFASQMPLSIRASALLWDWLTSPNNLPPFPGIVAVSLIDCSSPSYFWIPKKNFDQTRKEYDQIASDYIKQYFSKFLGSNDLKTCLNMWIKFHQDVIALEPKGINEYSIAKKKRLISNWCKQNSINHKKLTELIKLVQKLVRYIEYLNNTPITIGPFTEKGVFSAINPFLLKVYSNNIYRHVRDLTYIDNLGQEYKISSNPINTITKENPPPGIIAITTSEIQRTIKNRFINFAVETSVDSSGNKIEPSTKRRSRPHKQTSHVDPIAEAVSILKDLHGISDSSKSILNALEILDSLNSLDSLDSLDSFQQNQGDGEGEGEGENDEGEGEDGEGEEDGDDEDEGREDEELQGAINLLSEIDFNKKEKALVRAHDLIGGVAKVKQNSEEKFIDISAEFQNPCYDATRFLDLINKLNERAASINIKLPDNYNPPLVVEKVESGEKGKTKVFNLIQETYLPAGTKQRGVRFFADIKQEGYNEVVLYSTGYGYGQVAAAWCCKAVGLKCTIFIHKAEPRTNMTEEAIKLDANIIEKGGKNDYVSLMELSKMAENYAKFDPKIKMLSWGMSDEKYIEILGDEIKAAAAASSSSLIPKTIWVAGGSGSIAKALSIAFPNAFLNIVQVGKSLKPDTLVGIKHKIYTSRLPFTTAAKVIPPYQSLDTYDAKIWEFVSKYGKTGDYIWNVK